MHSAQEEVHTEVSDEDAKEGDDGVPVEEARVPEGLQRSPVEGEGIDQQGNQGPCFLRVPGPVAAPGDVRPDGAEEGAEGEEEHRRIQHDEAHVTKVLPRLGRRNGHAHDAVEGHQAEERVGHHHGQHVDGQERRLEDRHQRHDLGAHPGPARQQHRKARQQEAQRLDQREPLVKQQDSQRREPRHQHHHIVSAHIRTRAGDIPAKADDDRQVQPDEEGDDRPGGQHPGRILLPFRDQDATQDEQDDPEGQAQHELHLGPGDPDVQAFRLHLLRRRDDGSRRLLLIGLDALQDLFRPGDIARRHRLLHEVRGLPKEGPERLVLIHLLRELVRSRIPGYGAGRVGKREDLHLLQRLDGRIGALLLQIGIERTYPVSIVHVHVAQGLFQVAGTGRRSADGRKRQEERHRRRHGCDPPERSPEGRILLEEESDHGQEQDEIACIGDSDAPGVVTHSQDAALPVLVVIGLVETVAPVLGDVVHGYRNHLIFGEEGDLGAIVGRHFGAVVVLDGELVQPDAEREFGHRLILQFEGAFRLPFPEMDHPGFAEDIGHERSGQDHHEAYMQGHRDHPLGRSVQDQIDQPRHGRHRPQGDEQRIVIKHVKGDGRTFDLLDDGGGHHHHDEDRRRAVGEIFASSFHTGDKDNLNNGKSAR